MFWMENFAVTVLGKLCEAVETTESHDLHGWIGGASKFTMPLILLEYVIRIASQSLEFSIDYNTIYPKWHRNVPRK